MLRLPIILAIASLALAANELNVLREWKFADYVWDDEHHKDRAIAGGLYDPSQIILTDLQKDQNGRMFVTTPRTRSRGIPASLAIVSHKKGPGGHLLQPYPNWEWHNASDCTGMTSVWRVTIDDCNRLWVLDTGKVGDEQKCPAQLLAFDSESDELLKRIVIPKNISHNPKNGRGRLTYPVVETEGTKCEKTYVYTVDHEGGGLVIHDGSNFSRLKDDVFHPEPIVSEETIAGEKWKAFNGLVGLALTPKTSSLPQKLFFRGLATLHMNWVLLKDVKKAATTKMNVCSGTSMHRFHSPLTAQTFSRHGIMFFGKTKEIAIGCWNSHTPMDEEHLDTIAQDNTTLQSATSLKITNRSKHSSREELWVLTNRIQRFQAGTLDLNEINYRILSGSVKKLVKGTRCEIPRRAC